MVARMTQVPDRDPLLETKLHVPRGARGLVPRQRLRERLSAGAGSALTLISAPAGFGKTTLLTEWLAAVPGVGPSVGWLSLDEADNDPSLFWKYVVWALRSVAGKEVGAGALSLLESSQAPTDAVLTTLINDLFAVSEDVILVLDDYHVIEAPEVHDGVVFLLEHLPPRMHLIIASRADPPFSLARWRGDGGLTEIRAADLRFTPEESATYLDGTVEGVLTTQDVATLGQRTEGWIAALQLAALSMQGRDDLTSFIAGFAGDDRYIVDYLAEEVLQRQSEDVRQFLLQTSILDRLTGPLCDAVTGQGSGRATLVMLERANLFLVPLDDRRRWYRYHHLFADVLRAHVLDEQPDDVPALHSRASAWFEQSGEPTEAIRHSLAAGDFDTAANLAELAIRAMAQARQEATMRGWLKVLPAEVVRVRPVLTVGFAGALLLAGEFEGVESRLRDAERWLDVTGSGAPSAEMIVADEAGFRSLPGTIEAYRAALALVGGDVLGTVTHARRALELSPEEDHLIRAAAAGVLGLASWTTGDLEAGYEAYAECVNGLQRVGHTADIFGCSIALADIRRTQGRLRDAMHIYEHALQANEPDSPVVRGTADMYVGMSELYRERDDLQTATDLLGRSRELGDHVGMPQNRYRWLVAMARLREAEGNAGAAVDLLDEAERAYVGDFFPNVRPVAAVRARSRLLRGELGEALAWVRERGLSAQDDLSYLREFEHVTLARILLALHRAERSEPSLQDAARLLDRLLAEAESGGRTGTVIEILAVQSLAHQAHGDMPAAVASLQRAVSLAEPEGYVRIFTDEGAPMGSLLRALASQGSAGRHARQILAISSTTDHDRPSKQPLLDPLSDRELDVLRLLGTDLSGPEIARELVVSLNTVRTHQKHIYTKLGVNNRGAAVRQGDELKLLSRHR
jgi:LuxR family transcriptional regulator, maltose regulon positive regulatory protein